MKAALFSPFFHYKMLKLHLLLAALILGSANAVQNEEASGVDAKWTVLAAPASFDERSLDNACTRVVQDQGRCASSFAFAASRIFADRLCRATNGKFCGTISEQEMITCYKSGQFYQAGMGPKQLYPAGFWSDADGCQGGDPVMAWMQMQEDPRVSRWADPYTLRSNTTRPACSHKSGQDSFDFTTAQTYKWDNAPVDGLKTEINASGPIACILEVYEDFVTYTGGVYTKGSSSGASLGHMHAAIIGWGEEAQVPYWILAMSWGPHWGEGGYARVRLGTNELGIESSVTFPVPSMPTTLCTTTCKHGGELMTTCQCRCPTFRSGATCDVCNPTCENGGVAEPVGCQCLCPLGFFGERCEQYALFQWTGLESSTGKGTFYWRITDWHGSAAFLRYTQPYTTSAPTYGGFDKIVTTSTGTLSFDTNVYAFTPGYPRGFFFALRISMGTNPFGTTRQALTIPIANAFFDETRLCFMGGTTPPSAVPCSVDCQLTEWVNVGSCSLACGGGKQTQTRTITANAQGSGVACGQLVQTIDCNMQPCESQNHDCQGSWSACTSACETALQRTFTQTQAQQGTGAACPVATNCTCGDGCGTVLKANIGWTGGESVVSGVQSNDECCTICKNTGTCIGWVYNEDKTCYQKKAASAAGISLIGGPQNPQNTHSAGLITVPTCTDGIQNRDETGVDCGGSCGNVCANADCLGSWSTCTSACEKASARTWTETQAQKGNGAGCPAAMDCTSGEGQCEDGCGTVLKANIGWTGAESAVANVDSSGECCNICKDTPSCVGWVYNLDKYCYQKKAASAAGISLTGGPANPQNTHSAGLISNPTFLSGAGALDSLLSSSGAVRFGPLLIMYVVSSIMLLIVSCF